MSVAVKVIKKKCIGCGKCYQIAPEIFDFDDDGLAQNFLDENEGTSTLSNDQMKLATLSMHACPTDAIILVDKKDD